MKELARRGAPVWDTHSYSKTYDPSKLPNGTQFVMTALTLRNYKFAADLDGIDEDFIKTDGLIPFVYEVVQKAGLTHTRYTYHFSRPYRALELMCFIDPSQQVSVSPAS